MSRRCGTAAFCSEAFYAKIRERVKQQKHLCKFPKKVNVAGRCASREVVHISLLPSRGGGKDAATAKGRRGCNKASVCAHGPSGDWLGLTRLSSHWMFSRPNTARVEAYRDQIRIPAAKRREIHGKHTSEDVRTHTHAHTGIHARARPPCSPHR